eukprot:2741122-Rhodomonas_salina.1
MSVACRAYPPLCQSRASHSTRVVSVPCIAPSQASRALGATSGGIAPSLSGWDTTRCVRTGHGVAGASADNGADLDEDKLERVVEQVAHGLLGATRPGLSPNRTATAYCTPVRPEAAHTSGSTV